MCTINTDVIYLTWRKDVDKVRRVIGLLKRESDNYTFEYLNDNVQRAIEEDGFSYYQPFLELKKYENNVLEFFKRRLLNPQRRDYDDFLNYWGAINYKDDVFSLLGLTGAKLLTDNFEFIAPHKERPARFNTDVSWLNTSSEYVVNSIKSLTNEEVGKRITLVCEPNNEYDKKAVKVMFENEKLGYIKSIHCDNVFDALTENRVVQVKVANIIKNGTIKEVLLRINID